MHQLYICSVHQSSMWSVTDFAFVPFNFDNKSITRLSIVHLMIRCARRTAAIAQRVQRSSLVSVQVRRPSSSQAIWPAGSPQRAVVKGVVLGTLRGIGGLGAGTALGVGTYVYVGKQLVNPAEVVEGVNSMLSIGKPAHEALLQVIIALAERYTCLT
jgi:hypothetical protein